MRLLLRLIIYQRVELCLQINDVYAMTQYSRVGRK